MLKRPFMFVIPVPDILFWCPCRTLISLASAYLGCPHVLCSSYNSYRLWLGCDPQDPTSVDSHPIFWLQFLFSPFCVFLDVFFQSHLARAYPRSNSLLVFSSKQVTEVVLGSRVDSTTASHLSGFRRWRSWPCRFPKISALPATSA